MTIFRLLPVFFFMTFLTLSSFFFFQMDLYRNAVAGTAWIYSPPGKSEELTLESKLRYEKKIKEFRASTPQLFSLSAHYSRTNPPTNTLDWVIAFDVSDRDMDDFLHISPLPEELNLTKLQQNLFAKERPTEYAQYVKLVQDLKKYQYRIPTPSNPPVKTMVEGLRKYTVFFYASLFLSLLSLGALLRTISRPFFLFAYILLVLCLILFPPWQSYILDSSISAGLSVSSGHNLLFFPPPKTPGIDYPVFLLELAILSAVFIAARKIPLRQDKPNPPPSLIPEVSPAEPTSFKEDSL